MSEPFRRIHYAAEPVTLDRSRVYEQSPVHGTIKPVGLWYSAPCDDDGWEHWCRAEEFAIDRLEVPHVVELDLERMLVIRDIDALDAFHEKFFEPYPDAKLVPSAAYRIGQINWEAVATTCAGVEIAPYLWDRRLQPGFTWYYGWDCSSGVVWDLDAVTAFEEAR